MSNTYPSSAPGTPDFDTHAASDSGPDAKERATEVKDTSVAAGQHVAGVAKDELHKVGSETKQQAKDLYRQTQGELADQAATQQKRVASGIRTLGDELGSMADKSDTQGVASDIAHQAASRAAGIADWLDQRDPGALLNEVKGYARRSPGMFITIAAVAGVVAGRLTRSVIAEAKDSAEADAASPSVSTPAVAPTGVGTGVDTEFGVGATTGIDTAFDTPTTSTGTASGTPAGVGTPLAAEYPDYTENRNE